MGGAAEYIIDQGEQYSGTRLFPGQWGGFKSESVDVYFKCKPERIQLLGPGIIFPAVYVVEYYRIYRSLWRGLVTRSK